MTSMPGPSCPYCPATCDEPAGSLDFVFSYPNLVIFDSADDGREPDKTISSIIETGRYRILTQVYDPDPSCSLVLHRFDRIA